MKVKVISRNPDEYIRETKQDINKGKSGPKIMCVWPTPLGLTKVKE